MTIKIGEISYTYEHCGQGVYRIMSEHDRAEENGFPAPGWRHAGYVRSENESGLKDAIQKAEAEGWPYVERPQ